MKKLLIVLAASVGLYSCEEKGPAIDFGGTQYTDTSYTAAVESKELHRVLVEEFTGAACPNCPVAREQLADRTPELGERLIVLGIHIYGIPQGAPVEDHSKFDFRTQEGTDILNSVFGSVTGIPAAGIDRIPVNGISAPNRSVWDDAIDARLTVTPPVNLHLESNYSASSQRATIKVKIAYTEPVDFAHALSVVVFEDSIVDAQEYPDRIQEGYTFMHVVRDYVTSINGMGVLTSVASKSSGQVYEVEFSYPVDESWNPEHCKVVAYVHRNDGSSKEVLQSAEAHLSE